MRILASGVPGTGRIRDTWGVGYKNNRAPNGDYFIGIRLETSLDGQRARTSSRIHQVPKSRTHILGCGALIPVKADPDDPKRVEIDWANYDCTLALRWRIGRLMPKRIDRWWRYESPDEAAEEVLAALTKYVLPHLERYASRALLRRTAARRAAVMLSQRR